MSHTYDFHNLSPSYRKSFYRRVSIEEPLQESLHKQISVYCASISCRFIVISIVAVDYGRRFAGKRGTIYCLTITTYLLCLLGDRQMASFQIPSAGREICDGLV